jgi:eukaryotic-like serine/threonine-protein kinase
VDSLTQDTLLGDRYRLDRRIAVGGMGEVWRAEDSVLSRTVAVKVLKTEFSSDPTFLERFRTEARTTASLSHAGIAGVFDYGEAHDLGVGDAEDGSPVAYLVMEHVDGEPLSAQLAREGRLPAARVLEVVRQAALALSEAHRVGMVHRDVKPGNLLVRRSDRSIKITDFGIARAADAVPLTQNGMVVGTAQYFSPEQAEGRLVGPASDVYSLGVVAYECLAGRLPFLADSPVAVAMMQIRDTPPPLPPDVPAPVRALVLRTLAKDPRARFASGGELAEAVRAVQEGRWDGGASVGSGSAASGASLPGQAHGPAGAPGRAFPPPPPAVHSAAPSFAVPAWASPSAVGPPTGPQAVPPQYRGAAASPAFPAPGIAGPVPGPDPSGPPLSGAGAVPAGFGRTPGTGELGGGRGQGPGSAAFGGGAPGGAAPGPTGPPAAVAGPGSPGPHRFAGPPVRPGVFPAGAGRWAQGPPPPYQRRRAPRWPLWIVAALLLALAAAAVLIVLLTDRDRSGGGRPDPGARATAAAGTDARIASSTGTDD